MLKYILSLILILTLVEGDFDIKLKYCRLRCGCGYAEEGKGGAATDYYWRDFYGTIPSDAFPIGDENQYPQTYVGLVYDPAHNGTYATTIVDGLDYVYNAVNGTVVKITDVIQILCTQEPDRFAWMTLTNDNKSSVSDYSFVKGGVHKAVNSRLTTQPFFLVKLSKCKIGYASSTSSLSEELEFAAIDGSLQKSSEKMFLFYKKNKTESEEPKKRPFISHNYKYKIRGGSIIPSFYKELNIGSCSLICTNEETDKKEKMNHPDPMDYFWKPSSVLNQNEAILVGRKSNNKSQFIGQAYISINYFDVGNSEGQSVVIQYKAIGIFDNSDTHILSTTDQKKFEWTSTTTDEFPSLDQSKMIRGGKLYDGTKTFVGRETVPTPIGTSIRLVDSGAYSFSLYGPVDKFDILMIRNE